MTGPMVGATLNGVEHGPRCYHWCHAALIRHESGEKMTTIAVALGIGYTAIRTALLRHGFAPRVAGGTHLCGARCDEIRHMYGEGFSLEAIALKYGVSRERIRQLARYHGMPKRVNGRGQGRRAHVCDNVCEALKVAPANAHVRDIADRFGIVPNAVRARATLHRITVTRGHICRERCVRLIARLRDTGERVYVGARAIGIPTGWVATTFRSQHPEWPVRKYRGQR